MSACPACARPLEEARRIPGELPEEVAAFYSCSGCLGVFSRTEEQPGSFREEAVISGAAVARLLERIGESEPGEVFATLRRFQTEAGQPRVWGVPEVFAEGRGAGGPQALLFRPAFFNVVRETRAESRSSGSVSVEGYWAPAESDLVLFPGSASAIESFRRFPVSDPEPCVRQPPALLQLLEGQVMLEEGAPLSVLGGEAGWLRLKPIRSEWARSGAIQSLRATLDLLSPDPNR